MADSVADSIVIAADVDTILEIVADFAAYPDWQDEMKEVEVLDVGDDGWATKARFVIDAGILTTTMVLAYTYTADAMSWTLVEGDIMRRNDGVYRIADNGDGTSKVTYELMIDLTIPLPGLVKRKAAKKIVDSGLHGLKRRAESLS